MSDIQIAPDKQPQSDFYCSTLSHELGEQLFGTATRADVWLLLQYPYLWGRDALLDSRLPDEIKARLTAYLKVIPNARFHFIKQYRTRRVHTDGITFYVMVTRPAKPVSYHFQLRHYKDLLDIDIAAVVAGDPVFDAQINRDPLYIVCVNGKRDRCCAKFGSRVYQATAYMGEENIWQTTHIGGHRFAATMVCFPHGVCYGRVRPGAARTIINDYRQGRIMLEHYRGRSHDERLVQVADYFLREATGIRELDHFRLVDIQGTTETGWQVQFAAAGQTHRIQMRETQSEFPSFGSCGDVQPSRISQYELVQYECL
jgi:hypothetical protein